MTSAQFAALDYVVNAVGDPTVKALGGKEIVDPLVASGHLEKKGKLFAITDAGRAAHAKESTPERVKAREEEAKRQATIRFLTKVEAGEKIAKKDGIPADVIEEAKRLRLVAPLKKDNYELLPAGKSHLTRCQAEEGQRAKQRAIDEIQQKLQTQVEELRGQLKQQLHHLHEQTQGVMKVFDGSGTAELESALADIKQHNEKAVTEFAKALDELSGFTRLAAAVVRFRSSITQGSSDLDEKVKSQRAQIEESKKQLRDHEAKLNEFAGGQQAKIEEFRRQTESHLAEVEKKFRETPMATTPHPTPTATSLSESAVWEATKREYQRIHQENARFGGIVGIPELTDAVRRSFADLTPAQFHEFLQGWERQDRLTLQLCSTPNQEPRAQEGIHSARGLLLYVHLR